MPNDFHTDAILPLLYHKPLHGECRPKNHFPFQQHGDSVPSSHLQPTSLKRCSASPMTKYMNKSIRSIPLWNNNRMMAIQYQFLRYPFVIEFLQKYKLFPKPAIKKRIAESFGLRYSSQFKKLDCNHCSFFFKVSIISTVILSRSYLGFQPHSLRAQLSSILFGQLSAMA